MIKQPGDVLSRLALQTFRWPLGHWYWGDAICVDGLLAASPTIPAARLRAMELVRGWLDRVPPGYHDALAPGAAIAAMVGDGELPASAADRFLRAVEGLPPLFLEVPALEPHLPQFRFGLCIDAVYHLPPALAAIGRLRSDDRLISRAGRMVLQMLERLRCPSGFAHWYDVGHDRNNQVPWSRGVGWALLGALDTVALSDDPATRAELAAVCLELWAALGVGAEPSGWGPVLGRQGLPRETSVAAFVVAAAHHPAALVPVRGPLYELARQQLLQAIDRAGVCRGVSADVLPRWERASYESFQTEPSPWGQGVALRAVAALAGQIWVPGFPLPQRR